LKELKEIKGLGELFLGNTRITDAGLKELKELPNLSSLDLNNTKTTNAGLQELKGLPNLSILSLCNTNVTDAGLKELKEIKKLSVLDLGYTQVTDNGLKEMKNLKSLSALYLDGTQVTDAGIKELQELKNVADISVFETKVTNDGLKGLTGVAAATKERAEKAPKISLTLNRVRGWKFEDEVLMVCDVVIDNQTGEDLIIYSSCFSAFDGLTLLLLKDGGIVVRQGYTFHQTGGGRRPYLIKKGKNQKEIRIPIHKLPLNLADLQAKIVGNLPGCKVDVNLESKPVKIE